MNEIKSNKKYLETREHRERFIETGEIHPDVRPFIAESWTRCRQYNVLNAYSVEKLSSDDCAQLLKENVDLLRVAHPAMMELVRLVEGTQYVVSLHNKEGWILGYLFAGDNPVFSARGFDVGTLWAEKTIGTCSTNIAVQINSEVQLIGYEHYNEQMKEIVGTAAPIHDEQGSIIGVLNMCGHYANGGPHTLGLVKTTALLIENRLSSVHSTKLMKDTFDMISNSVVVLNEHYQVQMANFRAASILRMPIKALYSLDIRTLFRKEDFEDRIEENAPFSYTEYELDLPEGRSISCSIEVSPIRSGGKRIGSVVEFRESRVAHNITNQLSGNHAIYKFEDIITQDAQMLAQIDLMKDIADTDCCVLIEGESGTGKELFAHALHNASGRHKGPFIAVNCASLPRSLVESELFGYEKGAFTGARSEGSPGKFELADGGTIFLDEVGELPLEIQATLLRVLDNHKIVRIGGKSEKLLNVRVIAATNRNLYQEVQDGNFRGDLYFRINVLKFDIPPLRERGSDIALLAQSILEQVNQKGDTRYKVFAEDFLAALTTYSWPGNVRELQNVIIRSYYACRGIQITADGLPANMRTGNTFLPKQKLLETPQPQSYLGVLADLERQSLIEALKEYEGDIEQVGTKFGMSKSTVYRRLRKYQITL